MWISIESCIPGTIFSDCTQKLYSNGKMVFLLLTKRDIFFLFSSFSFSILFFLNNKECTFPLHFVFLCKIFLRFVLFFSTIKYFFPKYFFLIPNWSSWPSDNQGFKVHYWVWNAQYTRSNFYMGFVGNGKVFFSTFWNMHSFKCNDVAFWHIILYSCPSRSIPTYLADWLSDCHGGPGGHGQDTQERQNLHLNLTFQVTWVGQLRNSCDVYCFRVFFFHFNNKWKFRWKQLSELWPETDNDHWSLHEGPSMYYVIRNWGPGRHHPTLSCNIVIK